MKQNKRLDKVEASLTPKQAMLKLLQEVKGCRDLVEMAKFQRSQPGTLSLINRWTSRVAEAVEASLKGEKKEVAYQAARRAVKDLAFLYHLFIHVNERVMREQRAWRAEEAYLAVSLAGLYENKWHRDNDKFNAGLVSVELPYPVDKDAAATVEAAARYHVTTWEQMDQDCTLDDWLWDHLLAQGATKLPDGCYHLHEGEWVPRVDQDNEKEVRACFKTEAEFEKFRFGEDYHQGLANVTDAEYTRHYDRLVSGMREMVDSGKVQAGVMVHLETVPLRLLQEAPLVEGKWLDRAVVELAEWGALMRAKGYQAQEAQDGHPLAPCRFVRKNGQDVDSGEAQTLRKKAVTSLKKFPGKTRKIDGSLYLSFQDYCKWRGRKVKGDLKSGVKTGLLTASWNAWVEGQGEKATVAGVTVDRLSAHIEASSHQVCADDAGERLTRRNNLLDDIRGDRKRGRKDEAKIVPMWRQSFLRLLAELCLFQEAVGLIGKHYYDGHQVLLTDHVEVLAELLGHMEKVAGVFNRIFPDEEGQVGIDLEALHGEAKRKAVAEVFVMADMARMEALNFMGEHEAAEEIAERYV